MAGVLKIFSSRDPPPFLPLDMIENKTKNKSGLRCTVGMCHHGDNIGNSLPNWGGDLEFADLT